MACFDNLIGLRGVCDPVTPSSGFYLDDIGIDKKELEDILTKDYPNAIDFVNKKQAFAVQKVTGEIYSFLSPKFKADSILAGNRVGYEAIQKELINQSGYVGVEIKVKNLHSYIDFTISDFSLFVDVTATVPLLLYDVKQGLLLDTINIDAVAGQISTLFEKVTVSSPRKDLHLWLGYNAAAINSYKTTTHNGCSTCSGYTFNHRFIQASGAANSSNWTQSQLSPLTHTGGISFNYSATCNHTDWLCSHAKILGVAFLYKTGIEIVNHGLLASPFQRTMNTTTVNREILEQKLALFTHEYDKIMLNILQNMAVPNDKQCFECERRITSKFTAP